MPKIKNSVIVELDFDCDAQEIAEPTLEEFSLPLIKSMNKLYSALQRESIVDLATSKTETKLAYDFD